MSTPSLSIIIPAHNEAERLPSSLEAVKRFISSLPFETEVIVVENNSSDGTAEIVREWMKTMPPLRLISLARPGKGMYVTEASEAPASEAWRFADSHALTGEVGEPKCKSSKRKFEEQNVKF